MSDGISSGWGPDVDEAIRAAFELGRRLERTRFVDLMKGELEKAWGDLAGEMFATHPDLLKLER